MPVSTSPPGHGRRGLFGWIRKAGLGLATAGGVGPLFQQTGKTALADNVGLFSSSSDVYAAVQANGFNNASGVIAGSDTNYGVYGSSTTATGVYGKVYDDQPRRGVRLCWFWGGGTGSLDLALSVPAGLGYSGTGDPLARQAFSTDRSRSTERCPKAGVTS